MRARLDTHVSPWVLHGSSMVACSLAWNNFSIKQKVKGPEGAEPTTVYNVHDLGSAGCPMHCVQLCANASIYPIRSRQLPAIII